MNEQHIKALKCMVFAQSFVEALDDFGGSSAFKQQIKLKGLSFAKEVDKYLNTVYKDGGAERPLIDIIERCQQAIDEVIDNEIVVTDETNEMSKEKRTKEQIIESMTDIMPFDLNDNVKPYVFEAMDIYLEEHTQQSEPKDNDVEGLALEVYPNDVIELRDGVFDRNRDKRKGFIKGYTHNTAELERLRKVNGELVDAAFELGAQAFSECMHPHSHEFDHKLFRQMKSEALANAKTKEG